MARNTSVLNMPVDELIEKIKLVQTFILCLPDIDGCDISGYYLLRGALEDRFRSGDNGRFVSLPQTMLIMQEMGMLRLIRSTPNFWYIADQGHSPMFFSPMWVAHCQSLVARAQVKNAEQRRVATELNEAQVRISELEGRLSQVSAASPAEQGVQSGASVVAGAQSIDAIAAVIAENHSLRVQVANRDSQIAELQVSLATIPTPQAVDKALADAIMKYHQA